MAIISQGIKLNRIKLSRDKRMQISIIQNRIVRGIMLVTVFCQIRGMTVFFLISLEKL